MVKSRWRGRNARVFNGLYLGKIMELKPQGQPHIRSEATVGTNDAVECLLPPLQRQPVRPTLEGFD